MIITENVSKNFDSFNALDGVSFNIDAGEIVGFIGKNGAGKTTLMRILTSYYRPSTGTVLIDGKDIQANPMSVRRNVGYLPETPPLYLNMTVKDYLTFAAQIKEVPASKRCSQLNSALEQCQLEEVANKVIGNLSKGYKQRTGIAQAIIHDPKILILDEPTSGLDPIQNRQLRSLIANLKDQRTVIVSTHILSEIEQIAQRVLMIKKGRLIVDEPLADLLNKHSTDQAPASLEDVFVHYHQDKQIGGSL